MSSKDQSKYSFWERNSFIDYDFIVIGSGILGLSAACEIKERSPERSVLILERGILPSGASTKNAGFACFGSLTEILADIKKSGEQSTKEVVKNRFEGIGLLRQRLGDEKIGYLNFGGYELISDENISSIEQIEFVNKMLSDIFEKQPFDLRNDLVSKFGFDSSYVKALVMSPYEGQIDTGKMMRCLIDYAVSLGIRIINGCSAESFSEKENYVRVNVQSISEKNESFFNCKTLIACTNAFTEKIFPNFKVTPGRGQVLVTKPISDLKFEGVFHFDEGYYYFRNFENRIIFGGARNLDFESERTTEFNTNEIIYNHLLEKLDTIILPGQKYEIDYTWSGIMGFNEAKKPEVKKISDRIFSAISCNGMGIALSPFVARGLLNVLNLDFQD